MHPQTNAYNSATDGYDDIRRAIARLYENPNFLEVMRRLGENPAPIRICTGCWFELRTTEESERHVCPPEPV
jgi:hypothetical protein